MDYNYERAVVDLLGDPKKKNGNEQKVPINQLLPILPSALKLLKT